MRSAAMVNTALCLLIGGESQRMKQDKAQLRLPSGKMLVELMVEKLAQLAPAPIFLSGDKQFAELSNLPNIPDIFKNKVGPVGAIISCGKYLAQHFPRLKQMILIPVDIPKLSINSLQQLHANTATAAYFANNPLPLKLKITPQLLMVIDELILPINRAGGYSVRQFMAKLDSYETLIINDPNELINFNYPEQWLNYISSVTQ